MTTAHSAVLITALTFALAACQRHASETPPNFVFIFVDDLGYGDIGPFGSAINHTPHLDRMAAQGRIFTSFYAGAPVCTPSRAALLTGCYARRVGLARGPVHGVLFTGEPWGLNPAEVTIAEILQAQGYATACIGKWHLGDQPEFFPSRHGFDEYYGIPYSNDMWPYHPRQDEYNFPPLPLLRDGEVIGRIKDMHDQSQLCRLFTEEAVDFIRRHSGQPFFLYLPHAFVHHPRGARKEFLDRTRAPGDRGRKIDWEAVRRDPQNLDMAWRTRAQIAEVDWSVGEILRTLEELEIAGRTLVFFTSDNGGARGCVNLPLRGGKGSTWEGGLRVPTLAWWPGRIPPNSTTAEIASVMDILPTFARLAGAEPPRDRTIDGQDISPLLFGGPETKSGHEALFYYRGDNLEAVRSGPWKLFRTTGALYNLDQDIGETTDVAARHPDVVARLEQHIARAAADLGVDKDACPNCRPAGIVDAPRPIIPHEVKPASP